MSIPIVKIDFNDDSKKFICSKCINGSLPTLLNLKDVASGNDNFAFLPDDHSLIVEDESEVQIICPYGEIISAYNFSDDGDINEVFNPWLDILFNKYNT